MYVYTYTTRTHMTFLKSGGTRLPPPPPPPAPLDVVALSFLTFFSELGLMFTSFANTQMLSAYLSVKGRKAGVKKKKGRIERK